MKIPIKPLVAIALVAMLIPSFTGCTETQYEPGEDEAPPVTKKLEILSHSMTGGRGEFVKPVVKGTAKNVSSATINAYIYVKFYDASGALLGTGADSITSLGAGETWSFKVTYYDIDREDVYSYKIKADSPF